jgi:hypothetical protein
MVMSAMPLLPIRLGQTGSTAAASGIIPLHPKRRAAAPPGTNHCFLVKCPKAARINFFQRSTTTRRSGGDTVTHRAQGVRLATMKWAKSEKS